MLHTYTLHVSHTNRNTKYRNKHCDQIDPPQHSLRFAHQHYTRDFLMDTRECTKCTRIDTDGRHAHINVQAEAPGAATQRTIADCIHGLLAEGGIWRFYRGFLYTLSRAGPVSGVLLPMFDISLAALEGRGRV